MKAEFGDDIDKAANLIMSGGVVAVPTETFYGLAVDARNEDAIRRVYQIKGRDYNHPILLLINPKRHLTRFAQIIYFSAEELMRRYWPGPLTLVFVAKKEVSPLLTANQAKIGMRFSSNCVVNQMVKQTGLAITGTSANLSGHPPYTSGEAVYSEMGGLVDYVFNGECSSIAPFLPSTVLDVSEKFPRIIRSGLISLDNL